MEEGLKGWWMRLFLSGHLYYQLHSSTSTMNTQAGSLSVTVRTIRHVTLCLINLFLSPRSTTIGAKERQLNNYGPLPILFPFPPSPGTPSPSLLPI